MCENIYAILTIMRYRVVCLKIEIVVRNILDMNLSFSHDIFLILYRLVYPELHTEVLSALDTEVNVYTWFHRSIGQATLLVRE